LEVKKMPILCKTKLDAIMKARKEGYTQKETAQRVGVDIKTVKRHDPLRTEKTKVTSEARIERLERISETLAAEISWLDAEVHLTLGALRKILAKDGRNLDKYYNEPEDSWCPNCCGEMIRDGSYFRCDECGFSAMELIEYVWHS